MLATNKFSPNVTRLLEGCAVWEPLGFRITNFETLRKDVPRQLLELARDQSGTDNDSLATECAEVLRSLCASLLILPAVAPPGCPVLNVEEISIANAVVYFRKGMADRLGPPVLCAPTYPNWELAASCYSLMLEAEYRGPVYLGTSRTKNTPDLDLGVWNFSVDHSNLIQSWSQYLEFCKKNKWYRDSTLADTAPGRLDAV